MRIKQESRTSTAVIDPTSGVQTEVNEPGPEVSDAEMSLFCEKLIYLAKGADICIFAGSHPRGVADNVYADLIGELKRQGVATVIDTDGEPMDLAMRAGPDLVSPNEREAEEFVGHEFRDREDHIFGLYGICQLGPREAIITHEEGCYALVGRDHERRLFEVRTERLEPVSAIGAGDAFLAGYLSARYSGRSMPTRCASRSPAAQNPLGASAPECSIRAPPSGSSTRSRSPSSRSRRPSTRRRS